MRLTKKEKAQCAEIKGDETIVDWDPEFKLQPRITFKADQFEKWAGEQVPLVAKLKPVSGITADKIREKGIPVGRTCYLYLRKMPTHVRCTPGFLSWRTKAWTERFGLKIFGPGKPIGHAYFDRPVLLPVLADITQMDRPWMSLTPNEILTQRAGVCRAKGHVMIGGLGLGWFAREILKRKQVTKISIVDTNADLLKVLGEPLAEEHGERVELVHDDVWKHLAITKTEYDSYLFDIWKAWPDAGYDDTFQKFKHANSGKVWGWGDSRNFPTGGDSTYW